MACGSTAMGKIRRVSNGSSARKKMQIVTVLEDAKCLQIRVAKSRQLGRRWTCWTTLSKISQNKREKAREHSGSLLAGLGGAVKASSGIKEERAQKGGEG